MVQIWMMMNENPKTNTNSAAVSKSLSNTLALIA